MPDLALITAAEISRLAGVTRATVSNWRRRHADFPTPSGGTEASPAYDLTAVRAWLAARGQLPAVSATEDLRAALRSDRMASAPLELLTLVIAAGRMDASQLKDLIALPDDLLVPRLVSAIKPYREVVPGAGNPRYDDMSADSLRTLLRSVAEAGAVATAGILTEGDLDDTASGNYQTPVPLAELMADLLSAPGKPHPTTVFDPACGSGGFLVAASRRGSTKLYGQDVVLGQAAQAAVRITVMTTEAQVTVRTGDSLRSDAFPGLLADAVLCAPPYGDRDWGHEELAYDPRWMFALPPKSESELAWVQHCLSHTKQGGWVVMLMPPATAERLAGRRIRADLVRSGTLRAVIALPVGAAPPLHIGLHLWLLQHEQPSPSQHVLFVDMAGIDTHRTKGTPTRRSAVDWDALRDVVLKVWNDYDLHPDAFDTIPGTASTISVVDLLDDAVDLTPARHVRVTPAPAQPDELAATAHAVRDRLRRAAAGLTALSGGEPWPPAGAEARSWRHATVADLLRGDALDLVRAPMLNRRADVDIDDTTSARTLTVQDVLTRRPPSGPPEHTVEELTIEVGDVILPEMLHSGTSVARVADATDAGHLLGRLLYLLRPDAARFDPWFLAGFLAAEGNLNAAASGTSVIRVDVRRLRIPLLPLAEQHRYALAFRRLHTLRVAADLTNRLADETARVLSAGLTEGALLPPDIAT
ncbi:N-6 DNA methylase [Actinoplanes sp. NPDC026670]|uniref:N-6 DNA methylase n=1 Tax=Actinoplanes sp. NPDC026670 TaxID=3154700 RepID=UPI0033CEEE7C